MKKIGNFLPHSNWENLKVKKLNKKGFAEETIETILKIIFFVGFILVVYILIRSLTKI